MVWVNVGVFFGCSMCLCVWWLFLTVSFAFLGWVTVVEDPLGIMGPGQAAELNPLQYIRQLGEVISFHETNRYPVWPTAAQTIRKIFTLLWQTAHWMEREKNKRKDSALYIFFLVYVHLSSIHLLLPCPFFTLQFSTSCASVHCNQWMNLDNIQIKLHRHF